MVGVMHDHYSGLAHHRAAYKLGSGQENGHLTQVSASQCELARLRDKTAHPALCDNAICCAFAAAAHAQAIRRKPNGSRPDLRSIRSLAQGVVNQWGTISVWRRRTEQEKATHGQGQYLEHRKRVSNDTLIAALR